MNCKKIKRQYIKAEAATVKPVTFTLPHKLSTQRQKGKLMKFIFSLNNIVPCILPPFSAPSFFFFVRLCVVALLLYRFINSFCSLFFTTNFSCHLFSIRYLENFSTVRCRNVVFFFSHMLTFDLNSDRIFDTANTTTTAAANTQVCARMILFFLLQIE